MISSLEAAEDLGIVVIAALCFEASEATRSGNEFCANP